MIFFVHFKIKFYFCVSKVPEQMKYDVFISYSSYDQKVVEGLCAYLEERKIRCFVAYRDIPRGVVWAKAIVEALDYSRMMVVVFSENFNKSDQVDREIEIASEDKKPILTFRIADEAFKGAKKYYLKNLNWIDAFPQPETLFGSVAENVAKLLDIDLGISKPIQQVVQTKTYKVGDYYDDGKKQGVVFEVSADGKHGKIVSLTESSERLMLSEKSEWSRLIGADDKHNGANNMSKVKQIDGWREKYPAFAWCADLGEGWYLPAIEELYRFTLDDAVHDAVNRTLAAKGKELKNKDDFKKYWSSTEYNEFCAWDVGMSNGSTSLNGKYDGTYVRAVSAF